MKKRWKIPLFILILFGTFFIWTGSCKAWGPPKLEDEEKFLQWYEANKNIDGAVYQLSADLRLTMGSEDTPLVWDGQGEVTIECGSHVILVDSSLVIDNPKLKITGNDFIAFMVRDGRLTLERGKVEYGGAGGVIVQVQGGKLAGPSKRGQFTLAASPNAQDVTGIVYGLLQYGELSNLDIILQGSDKAVGISTSERLVVENCNIQVAGGTTAYGVCQKHEDKELFIKDCQITASVLDPSGERNSVYSASGLTECENSVLVPKLAGDITYQILAVKTRTPVYVEPGSASSYWRLPETLEMYVQETGAEEETILSIPVSWDIPDSGLEEPGYFNVKGSFDTQKLQNTIVNPDGIIPAITVLSIPSEKMFLIASEVTKEGTRLLIPYPYGAEMLKVEYSADGEHFSTYLPNRPNMLVPGSIIPDNGLFLFSIPLRGAEQGLYVRFVVEGDSMFAGTSAAWKIGPGASMGIPDDAGDEQGGDRGGQDADTPFPDTEEPDTSPSVPGTDTPDGNEGQLGDSPAGENDKPSDGQEEKPGESGGNSADSGGTPGGTGGNPGESNGQPGTEGIKGEPSRNASYVNSGDIKNQEGNSDLQQGGNGRNDQETVKDDKSNRSKSGTKNPVQHISAEPEENEQVDQNTGVGDAEKIEKKQYPTGLAIALVIIGIAAAGYWGGKKVFQKK